MSVRTSERSEGQLELHKLACKHASYVIQITANKKIFAERFQTSLTDKLQSHAIDIYTHLWTANNIVVSSQEEYRERAKLQRLACAKCNSLLALIDIAKSVFHLKTKRVKYWASWVIKIRNMTRAWANSDAKRYKEYR